MQTYTKLQDIALVLLRAIIAAIFIYAGFAKWQFLATPESAGMPAAMRMLTQFLGVVEPLGAVALILGFLTRWAGAGLSIIMFGSLFFVYFTMFNGFFTSYQGTGLDYNVLILAGSLILAVFGAGKWSVDSLRKKA
jgi:putative oxidoreductase